MCTVFIFNNRITRIDNAVQRNHRPRIDDLNIDFWKVHLRSFCSIVNYDGNLPLNNKLYQDCPTKNFVSMYIDGETITLTIKKKEEKTPRIFKV